MSRGPVAVDARPQGERPLHERRYIPAFDGLRATLVAGVLAYHLSGATLPSATGEVAVIAFFSLSGFLITFLLADEYRATGSVRLRAFFGRRAVRLLPALGLLLVVWAIVALVFGHDPWITSVPGGGRGGPIAPTTVAETVAAAAGYVTNWLNAFPAAQLWVGYSPLGHLWSLAVEEQFYLIWAPVALFLVRRRWTGFWIAILALGLLVEPALLLHQGTNRVYFGTDTRMGALLAGAALGWWWRAGRLRWLERDVVARPLGLFCTVALLAAGVGFRYTDPHWAWAWAAGIVLASVAGAGLVLYVANLSDGSSVGDFLSRPTMRWLGRRSYAVYLWGYVFNTWFRSLGPACPVLTVVCTLAMAEASYRLVERPAGEWARRRRSKEAEHRASPEPVSDRPEPVGPSGRPVPVLIAVAAGAGASWASSSPSSSSASLAAGPPG